MSPHTSRSSVVTSGFVGPSPQPSTCGALARAASTPVQPLLVDFGRRPRHGGRGGDLAEQATLVTQHVDAAHGVPPLPINTAVSVSGVPTSVTARITVLHPRPSSRARPATVSASAPTRRASHTFARCVTAERGAAKGSCSVHVLVPHSALGQRQIRFHHTNTVARPPTGTSRRRCSRRS